jgi:hypothetical protein
MSNINNIQKGFSTVTNVQDKHYFSETIRFHLRTEAGSFRKVVFVQILVKTEKSLVNVGDITR